MAIGRLGGREARAGLTKPSIGTDQSINYKAERETDTHPLPPRHSVLVQLPVVPSSLSSDTLPQLRLTLSSGPSFLPVLLITYWEKKLFESFARVII